MGPLTATQPKPLLPVAGKPIIEHICSSLFKAGIKNVTLVIGWKKNALMDWMESSQWSSKMDYVIQKEQMGTAHAIQVVEDRMDGPFLCLNGDVLTTSKDIKDMIKLHDKKHCIIGLSKVNDIRNFGEITVSDGKVTGIHEKPERKGPGLANAGVYLFPHSIFKELSKLKPSIRGELEVVDAFIAMKPLAHELTMWKEIGAPWDLLNVHEDLMKDIKTDIKGEVEEHVTIKGQVVVKEGAVVKSGAYLVGPIFIDEGADVGPNCLIRGATYIGKNAKVGSSVEVKNSIIMDDTKLPHFNYLGDSVLGRNINMGAGTKVANLRLDNKNVYVLLNGKRLDTGRRKFGVIIGDNVKTGINASLNVGTVVGENTFLGPGAVIKGHIEADSRVY